VQLRRFQFLIEVLSSAHAKTSAGSAADYVCCCRPGKDVEIGTAGPRFGAIEDDDRAVCADTFARGSFGFVLPEIAKRWKNWWRPAKIVNTIFSCRNSGAGDLATYHALQQGQDATGQRAAGLFLDQQGAVVRNRRVRRIFAGCSGTKTAGSEFLSGKHDQGRIRDLGKNSFAGTKGAGRGIFSR
jgi:hypothetical protein